MERLGCRSVPGAMLGLSRMGADLGVLSQVALSPAVQPDDVALVAEKPTTSSVTPALEAPVLGVGLSNAVAQPPTPLANDPSQQRLQDLVAALGAASLVPSGIHTGIPSMDHSPQPRGGSGDMLAVTLTIATPDNDATVEGGGAFQSNGYVTPSSADMSALVTVDENTVIEGTAIVPPAKGYDWSFQFNNVPLNVQVDLTVTGQDPQTGEIGSDTHTIQCVA